MLAHKENVNLFFWFLYLNKNVFYNFFVTKILLSLLCPHAQCKKKHIVGSVHGMGGVTQMCTNYTSTFSPQKGMKKTATQNAFRYTVHSFANTERSNCHRERKTLHAYSRLGGVCYVQDIFLRWWWPTSRWWHFHLGAAFILAKFPLFSRNAP